MDSNNTVLKQLRGNTNLKNLVYRRRHNIKNFLKSLSLEQFIEVAETALGTEHLPLLDEHCCKKHQLSLTTNYKEKKRLIYLLKTYEKTILEKLVEDYNSVLLILTWAFVNRISVEEWMK